MTDIKVIGHVPADTDSVCAAIAYAWALNQQGQSAIAVVGSELNKESQFVLNHFGVAAPQRVDSLTAEDKYILVDTNNAEEMITGYKDAELVEIIDHHKFFGNIQTPAPITVTILPVGCTSTILWKKFKDQGLTVSKEIAGVLISAILSDTLKFISPTTTDLDRAAVADLAPIAGIDVDAYCDEMLAAKSDLTGRDPKEILLTDHKNFTFNGVNVKLAVLETTNTASAMAMIPEFREVMTQVQAEEGLEGVLFFIVDILNSSSHLIVTPGKAEELANAGYKQPWVDGVMTLPGVVSRKKQMVPALEAVG